MSETPETIVVTDFVQKARRALGNNNCFAVYQPIADAFPSIIYTIISSETLNTFQTGAVDVALVIRYDIRAQTCEEITRIDFELLNLLGSAVSTNTGPSDLYDTEVQIRRRLRTISLGL